MNGNIQCEGSSVNKQPGEGESEKMFPFIPMNGGGGNEDMSV